MLSASSVAVQIRGETPSRRYGCRVQPSPSPPDYDSPIRHDPTLRTTLAYQHRERRSNFPSRVSAVRWRSARRGAAGATGNRAGSWWVLLSPRVVARSIGSAASARSRHRHACLAVVSRCRRRQLHNKTRVCTSAGNAIDLPTPPKRKCQQDPPGHDVRCILALGGKVEGCDRGRQRGDDFHRQANLRESAIKAQQVRRARKNLRQI